MKNHAEIYQALLDGKKLTFSQKSYVWLEDGTLVNQAGNCPESNFLFPEDWEIYKEPKKSLTYEEAIACRKVRIVWPNGCGQVVDRNSGMDWALTRFDLAERRGYLMEEEVE